MFRGVRNSHFYYRSLVNTKLNLKLAGTSRASPGACPAQIFLYKNTGKFAEQACVLLTFLILNTALLAVTFGISFMLP